MMRKKIRFFLIIFLPVYLVHPSELANLKTVSIIEPGLAGVEINQKAHYLRGGNWLFLREYGLVLSVTKSTEFGLTAPQIEMVEGEKRYNRIGDVSFYVNHATGILSRYLLINFFTEINTGSGPAFDEIQNNPLEAYGYNEYRLGFITFKNFRYFSLHGNLFYNFRSQGESNLTEGITLNLAMKDTYNRAFGFNPTRKENFFYQGNFVNDNMEYGLGFNTILFYPFVPFWEITLAHDFYGKDSADHYAQTGPGAGIVSMITATGGKLFFSENNFAVKFSLLVPIGGLYNLSPVGFSLGFRLDF